MWLIKVSDKVFINAEEIVSVSNTKSNKLRLVFRGSNHDYIEVEDKYIDTVLNNISALDGNMYNLQGWWNEHRIRS